MSESPGNLNDLYTDIEKFLDWSADDLFSLDQKDVEELQLHWLRRRFSELRPQLAALDKLATDVDVDAIETLDDAIALCFPHTMLKAYTVADVEKKRFGRLNRWLDTMTIHDLSKVDVEGVESLDEWLVRLRAATPLEPQLSSGTSGKVSIQPKTVTEGRHLLMGMFRCYLPFGDEPGFDPRLGEAAFLSPWPARSGPHHITMTHTNAVRHIFGGDENMVITLGQHRMSADELWLSGRLRRAEAQGEQLELSDAEMKLAQDMARRARETSSREQMDAFIDKGITQQAGKRVYMSSTWQRHYEIALACKERGIVPDFAPGCIFASGGGLKGWTAVPGWREVIEEVFPFTYIEQYGMSECSATSRLCPEGHWHVPHWGVLWVLDPKTSTPLPRSGTQTGRLACLDLLAQSYWAGTLSGDRVTMHWDGGCGCGRKGPYLDKDIKRFTEAEGGDDKISCSRTPEAYDNLIKFTMSEIDA